MVSKTGERGWYGDACGAALALELIGERWALLVIRELLLGPRRFSELRRGLPGISANVLQQRLTGLEQAGLVRREPPGYALTEWGYEAEAPIQALGRWALRSPAHDPRLPLTPAAAMLSLRYLSRPLALAGQRLTLAVRFGTEAFVVRIDGGHIDIVRGEEAADVSVETDPTSWIGIVYGKRPVEAAEREGRLRVTGDRAVLAHFVTLFALPAKAAVE